MTLLTVTKYLNNTALLSSFMIRFGNGFDSVAFFFPIMTYQRIFNKSHTAGVWTSYTPGEPEYFPAAPLLVICVTPPENLSISLLPHHYIYVLHSRRTWVFPRCSIISYICYTPWEPEYFPAAPSLVICVTPPENVSISPLLHH